MRARAEVAEVMEQRLERMRIIIQALEDQIEEQRQEILRLQGMLSGSTIMEGMCPYYSDGTTCGGDVVFLNHSSFGTCKRCNREIPIDCEM